jgi:hypothetical protein
MHHAAASGSNRCRTVVTRATTTSGSWHAAHHAYERVLRYPDGNVRYIRYPVAEQTFDEDDEDFLDVPGLWHWSDHSGRPVTAGRPDMGQQLQQVQKQRQVCLQLVQACVQAPCLRAVLTTGSANNSSLVLTCRHPTQQQPQQRLTGRCQTQQPF